MPSTIEIPRNLTRPARGMYFAACLLADDTREVDGGQAQLAELMGYAPRQTREVLYELEAHRLIRRVRTKWGVRVFVLEKRQKGAAGCAVCGRLPLARINGARHCPTCYQTHGRPDRQWQPTAYEVWARGLLAGKSDMAIAYSIHVATGWPLWGSDPDAMDEPGQRGPRGGTVGVVEWGVSEGLFNKDLLRTTRKARRGEDMDL
jgi:hypothetical protein